MTVRTKCREFGGYIGKAVAVPAVLAATMSAVLAAATPGALLAQDDCEFTETIELDGPAVATLRVDAGSGSLSIRGVEGTNEFRLAAKLCASDQRRLEGLGVTLSGDRLETTYPSSRGGIFSWGGNRYARIDLAVEVPVDTNLRVDDGSGIIHINGTGDVTLEDGAGNIFVRDVRSLTLEDGAGNIVISDVGSLTVEDGAGNLRIRDVNGDLRLQDTSGSVDVTGVSGNVVVGDGSGNLVIRDVGGDVTVSDGSGSVTVETVGGSVHMDEVGSGRVTVRDVDGDLVVADGRRERIVYSQIRGKVDLPGARRGGSG